MRVRASEQKTKQQLFLAAFANCASVSRACALSGVARPTVYKWQQQDAQFAAQFAQASEDANDRIEDEIVRRAIIGYEEPVVSAGKMVFDSSGNPLMIKRYSDPLLTLLAKSRMAKYREKQQIDHSGAITITTQWGGGTLEDENE